MQQHETLLQAGVMSTVTILLGPTVNVGHQSLMSLVATAADGSDIWDDVVYGGAALHAFAEQHAHTAAGSVGGASSSDSGSWSEDEDEIDRINEDIEAAARTTAQITKELYTSDEVLEAVLKLLQQLCSRPESAAAALQQLPALPGFLIDILAVSSCHQQQRVLQALLPVLVVFKERVLPVLQPVTDSQLRRHLQQQPADEVPAEKHQQQQQQQQYEAEQQSKGLAVLACIAGNLRDCGAGADSLRAKTAGWYLLAAATHNMLVLQQHLWRLQLQQQQQQQRRHAVIPRPASCRYLEHLCMRLSRSTVPDAATNDAAAATHALAACVAVMSSDASLRPQVLYPLHVLYPQLAYQELERLGLGEHADQQQQQPEPPGVAVQRMHNSIVQASASVRLLAQRVGGPLSRLQAGNDAGQRAMSAEVGLQAVQRQQQQLAAVVAE
jgi:hypothetical protein